MNSQVQMNDYVVLAPESADVVQWVRHSLQRSLHSSPSLVKPAVDWKGAGEVHFVYQSCRLFVFIYLLAPPILYVFLFE